MRQGPKVKGLLQGVVVKRGSKIKGFVAGSVALNAVATGLMGVRMLHTCHVCHGGADEVVGCAC